MPIFRMFGGFEVSDVVHLFGQWGVCVFDCFDASLFYVISLWLDVDLLPNDLIDLPHWRFRLGTGLILVAVFVCRLFAQL